MMLLIFMISFRV